MFDMYLIAAMDERASIIIEFLTEKFPGRLFSEPLGHSDICAHFEIGTNRVRHDGMIVSTLLCLEGFKFGSPRCKRIDMHDPEFFEKLEIMINNCIIYRCENCEFHPTYLSRCDLEQARK
jgi:hypothetical protein